MLNRKFITKLLNDEFRKNILQQNSRIVLDKNLFVQQYAKYIVDQQILNRSKQFQNDKKAYYGFSPIAPVCYVDKNGAIKNMLFEMNSINHFLVKMQGENAVLVAECILVQLFKDNKRDIRSFNPQMIDAYLKAIEKKYIEDNKTKAQDEKEKSSISAC